MADPQGFLTVSYTHLDVYKRQEQDQSRFTVVVPRDYQRVIDVRAQAQAEGLDLDGTQVWNRIMEASRG